MRTGNSEKALLPGEEVQRSGEEKTGLEKPAGERRSLDFLWDLDSCGPRRLLGPERNVEPTTDWDCVPDFTGAGYVASGRPPPL